MSKPSHIAIKGDLTMNRIAAVMKRVATMPKKHDVVIDLKDVSDADSSAVAFLLNAIRIGRENGSTVRFADVPASIMTLADIYGLRAVLADASAQS